MSAFGESSTAPPAPRPGTVSRILWHFTGGPEWDPASGRRKDSPKLPDLAYEYLQTILQTKVLHLGQHPESVRVIIPEERRFNVQTRQTVTRKDLPRDVPSAPVCCLSDIPVQHLGYHAQRYGKFAIGFRREAAIQSEFNPVLYTLSNTTIIRSIYSGLSAIAFSEPDRIVEKLDGIEFVLDDVRNRTFTSHIADELSKIDVAVAEARPEAEYATDAVARAKESLERLLAFVKTFSQDEFPTIYCEREWRSLQSFCFTMDDIAMIVVPREIDSKRYFDEFVKEVAPKLSVPHTIPVVPWEDLVEH